MESIPHRFRAPRGFTLIELLVVTAIIIIITGVIFVGQSNFSNTVILSSTAYDLALSMQDAETYGLGTRGAQTGVPNAAFGLDFAKSSPRSYILFADSAPLANTAASACHLPLPNEAALGASAPDAYPGDCVYDAPGATDQLVSTYQIGNGVSITNFCAYNGAWSCSNTGSATLRQLDVVFLRPNGTPFISTNGQYVSNPQVSKLCIALTSAGNSSRYIELTADGQIIATASSCPAP